MKIDILCSSEDHPVNASLNRWISKLSNIHDINLLRSTADLKGGDLLFLVSCTEIVEKQARDLYQHAFVLHASDLPRGRGWSPHVWSILNGATEITVSLLNAEDSVDTGAIWSKQNVSIPPHALHDEINAMLFDTEILLMDRAIDLVNMDEKPVPQADIKAGYWPRRYPKDSEIDPARPLVDMFDDIRVADPARYPAFFRMRGYVYKIILKKVGKDGAH